HGARRDRRDVRARSAQARGYVLVQGAARRHRGDAARRPQARLREREACEAGRESAGLGRALCAGDGVSRGRCTGTRIGPTLKGGTSALAAADIELVWLGPRRANCGHTAVSALGSNGPILLQKSKNGE